MKVIDLLNKIATREELPKKISYENKIYVYYEAYAGYYEEKFPGIYNKKFLSFRNEQWHSVLNSDVEIIEEDKEVEEIEAGSLEDKSFLAHYISHNRYKINELVREVNKLKNNK